MKNNLKHIARITLFAFLLNALLPFFAIYQLPAAKPIASLFGEKILICTDSGFKWVQWNDLQSGKEPHKPHPDYQCPLCYVAAHGLKDTLSPVALTLDYRIAADDPVPIDYRYYPAHLTLRSSLHSRAPPFPGIA